MTPLDTRTTMTARDAVLSLALVAGLMVYVLVFYVAQTSGDVGAIYLAARFAGSGEAALLYWPAMGQPPVAWQAAQAALGVPHAYPYLYPPLWAHLLGPVALAVGFETFENLLLVVHVLAQAGSAVAAWRLFGRPGPLWPWMAAATLLVPVMVFGAAAFLYNNPQILVGLIVLWGLERYWAGARIAAALLIALAAAIKIYPALFALIFVFRGDWRGFALSAAFGAILLAVSVVLAGLASHGAWLSLLTDAQAGISIAVNNLAFQSVITHVAHWLGGESLIGQVRMPRPGWVMALQAVALPAVLAALWWRYRGASDNAWRRGFTPALLLVVTLAAPLAWTHYFTIVLCLLPGLFLILERIRAIALSALVIGANSLYLYADVLKPMQEPGLYPVIGFASLALMALVFALAGRRAAE